MHEAGSGMPSIKRVVMLTVAMVTGLGVMGSWSGTAVAATEDGDPPLVIVVHGIGGGQRQDGWSRDVARNWGFHVHEVTFRYEGRGTPDSYADFARKAGDWALQVRSQMSTLLEENPHRRVVVVSHSWGSVATAMAFGGGVGGGNSEALARNDYYVPAIDLGNRKIDQWLTLGSPLGQADLPQAGSLRQLNVEVPTGRPACVAAWTNIYDADDPVSMHSHNLEGASNIGVSGSGSMFDLSGLSAHINIWTHPEVRRFLVDTYRLLTEEAAAAHAAGASRAGISVSKRAHRKQPAGGTVPLHLPVPV
jgi:pimeloyl-ACP methyl ester carboxylesterase